MIAGLPMYERPELFQAHDNLWQLIHKQIDGSPQKLSRNIELWDLWTSPELLLAQTCSSPYRESLFKNTIYVGTPDYKLPNCPPGYYNSIIIGQSGLSFSQLKTGIFGYNDKFSHSGWTVPINHFKKLDICPKKTKKTGSHRSSAQAVADGQIDFAAIDAQSWRFIKKYDNFANKIKVFDQTEPTPGLPFITSKPGLKDKLFFAIKRAIQALSDKDRSLLYLKDLIKLDEEKYIKI